MLVVARSSDALDTLDASHAPVSFKRRLRSSVNMTANDDMKIFGERGNLGNRYYPGATSTGDPSD